MTTATAPRVATDRPGLAAARAALAAAGRTVALVPTMGALHEGHRALLRAARERADAVAVSIFVNPLQFGAGEDFDRYPRTLAADLDLCQREGVDLVFAPEAPVLYAGAGRPAGGVTVDPGPLGAELEGASRPGHFIGVLTVVTKLCHLLAPHWAVFGEKDYQQLVLVRRLVDDLDLPVGVVAVPTVREPDGLARSSRNRYLDPAQRRRAAALPAALRAGQAAAQTGAGPAAVLAAARAVLAAADGVDLDYLDLRDPDLGPAPARGPARLLAAARVGATRLIDNVPVVLDPAGRAAGAGKER
ncbi:MAG: pantoate--beta-alanine ligase [Actinomycetota bacterium]